jgi:hypothetical protein
LVERAGRGAVEEPFGEPPARLEERRRVAHWRVNNYGHAGPAGGRVRFFLRGRHEVLYGGGHGCCGGGRSCCGGGRGCCGGGRFGATAAGPGVVHGVEARKDAHHVAVHQGARFVERDGRHGAGGVRSHAGKQPLQRFG